MKYKVQQEEVLRATGPTTELNGIDVEMLKKRADQTKRKRIRICVHRSDNEIVQEMFIVHTNHTYIRPHKHLLKKESLHIIEGKTTIMLFGEKGKVKSVIPMGNYHSGLPFYLKMEKSVFHSMIISTKSLVFLEVTNGPFRRNETVFASWSPDESDTVAIATYRQKLLLETKKMMASQTKTRRK